MKNIFLFLLLLPFLALGQKVIPLYENVPGLKENHGLKETNISKEKDDIVRLRNVINPTLKIYEPSVNPTGSSVIICPGGGYYILAYDHEGEKVAQWFAERGVTAFVLKYRLPQEELFTQKSIRPLEDAQQAIRTIRSRANEWSLKEDKIGIMGFSAGGHLAATASTHFKSQVGETVDRSISVRPDFSILVYPVISFSDKYGHSGSRKNLIGPDLSTEQIDHYSNELQVGPDTPPAFLVHAFDDWVKIENSFAYAQALKQNGVGVELHAYQSGGHGFGTTKKNRGPVDTWTKRLEEWLRFNEFMK